jgi:HNH endonuclease/AP2 domain
MGEERKRVMSDFLRGRILVVDELTKRRWKSHLPLPCDDKIRAKLLANIVEKAGPLSGPCWIWKGLIDNITGYGKFAYRGDHYLVHRLSYRNLVGPFDEEFQINHRECNNRPCINPEHLYVGTQKENIADMHERGRAVNVKGEQHGSTRLQERGVIEVLQMLVEGQSQTKVAALTGFSQSHIGKIARGERRGDVPGPRPEPRKTSSQYRGVSGAAHVNKWTAHVSVNGRGIYLGTFETELAAAKAYNAYVIAHNLGRPLNNLWSTPTLTEIPFADLDPEWLKQVGA